MDDLKRLSRKRVIRRACNEAACSVPGGDLPNFVQNLIGLDGLDQVQVEAGITRALAIFILAPAGNGNEHRAIQRRLPTQAPRKLEAIDVG